jgi:hypothetical protein
MPSAFTVTNSPVTGAGTLTVTGAGTTAQYIRGDGTLANFPTSTGGGSSFNYYLNGSISQGTFGGDTYYQMSRTPILGAGTNFTRTNGQGDGYIASFITNAGDPSLLNIPGGNWNLEFYFQSSATGGSPQFYGEIYKVSAANVFTLVASGSANAEGITNGTTVDQYFTSIPVPQTSLLITDRIAIRIYVITSGRTITLHTENGNLCEVLTTFSTGLTALNGLTAQVQYLAVGTSGTDFNISSVTDTHTFNLPTASATNRGALSSTDWTTFNNKQNALTNPITGTGTANYLSKFTGSTALGNSLVYDDGTFVGIGTTTPSYKLDVNGTARIVSDLYLTVGLSATTSGNVRLEPSTNYFTNNRISSSGLSGFQISTSSILQSFWRYNNASGNTEIGSTSYGIQFFASNSVKAFMTSGGNFLIGTTTDAGYMLDVNGTTRSQGKLTITTGGAEITGNVVAYTGIQSYGQVQIFSAAAFQMFNAANNSKASFQYINANGLLLTTNSDNISGVLKGLQVNPTTVASANNDTLVGLDISPTFTAGAFTGVTTLGLRVQSGVSSFGGNVIMNGNNFYLGGNFGNTVIRTISTTNVQIFNNNAGATLFLNANGSVQIGQSSATNWALFSASGHTIYNSTNTYFFSTGNIGINQSSDAGYKLDVNGTARVITSLQVGNFTPGVAGAASTILTQGRISASGGITFYNPAAGDNQDVGFKAGGNGVAIYINNGIIGSFGGYGASLNPLLSLSSGFNPSSGTGNKTVFSLTPTYQTSGTFSGGITGILYSPALSSLTGVTYHRAIETVTGDVLFGTTSGVVGIGTTTLSTESNLYLGAKGTAEGGQLTLQKGTAQTYATHLDNYTDQFRILYGTDTGSTGVALAVAMSNRQLILPAYTTTSSFSGTVVGYLAFDSAGNVLTVTTPSGAVTSVNAGTGVSVSSTTGNVTVSIGQSVATSATPSFDQVFATNNGNGTNFKVGDDAWIGDVNTANALMVMGQQNAANGYIIFGNSNFTALGRSGTGALTYGGYTIYHSNNSNTITALGTITTGVWNGTAITDTYISSASTWNAKQNALTLTTTGTSGAATLVGATLNIPQYQSVLSNPVTGTGTTNYVTKWTSSSAVGSSVIYDDGTNIGVGTTTPGYKLDVNGTGRFTGTTNQITAYYDASNYMQLQHNSISVANTALLFNVNSAERMRLLSTGNLLIGTTTDGGYKLDVNGTTRTKNDFLNLDNSSNVRFKITDNTATGNVYTFLSRFDNTKDIFHVIFPSGALTSSNVNWNFGMKGGANTFSIASYDGTSVSERILIYNNGNVGIGTTTDSGHKLQVNGTAIFYGSPTISVSNLPQLTLNDTLQSHNWVIRSNGTSLFFIDNGNNRVWIGGTGSGNAGNVGIGTTSTSYKLDVNGSTRIVNTLTINGTGTNIAIQFSGGRIDADGTYLRIKSSGNLDMINIANNFVGINATSATASAVFQIDSTARGFLPPRMTAAQRAAISTPATGLVVYQTDSVEGLYVNTSSGWKALTMV